MTKLQQLELEELDKNIHLSFFNRRPTNDYWAPNCQDNTVYVRTLKFSNGQFGVVISGQDDTMYEKVTNSEQEMWAIYRRLPILLNFKELKHIGFKHV